MTTPFDQLKQTASVKHSNAGRKPAVDRPERKNITIPTSVLAKVELALYSSIEGRVPHGSWSELVTGLLREWLAAPSTKPGTIRSGYMLDSSSFRQQTPYSLAAKVYDTGLDVIIWWGFEPAGGIYIDCVSSDDSQKVDLTKCYPQWVLETMVEEITPWIEKQIQEEKGENNG